MNGLDKLTTAVSATKYQADPDQTAAKMEKQRAESNAAFAASQRATIDAILSKESAGEQLTEDEQDQLNMYERDENGNIKRDENGNYKVSESGMAAYRNKAATRSLAETYSVSLPTLRKRVDTSKKVLDTARSNARASRTAITESITAYTDKGLSLPPMLRGGEAFSMNELGEAAAEGRTGILESALASAKKGEKHYKAVLDAIGDRWYNSTEWSANELGIDGSDGYLGGDEKVARITYHNWRMLLKNQLIPQLEEAVKNSKTLNEAAVAYKNDEAALTLAEIENSKFAGSGR